MKLTRKYYYTKSGEKKINNYFIYIPTKIANQAKFNENTELKMYFQDGKIVIEKNVNC